jgi:hypothetical protein
MTKIAYQYQDNWKNFDYGFRYLDALASLLHVQTDVDATIEYEDNVYLSYNSTLTNQNKKYVNFIQNVLTNLKDYVPDHILGIYLTFNMDFIELVKKTRNHIDGDGRKLIETFVKSYKETNGVLEKNLKHAQKVENLDKFTHDIVLKYKSILLYLSENKFNYHLNTFLRPLQDSYKLYDFLVKSYMYKDLVVLENPNNLHADSNIIDYFKNSKYLDKNYVGVSKLCCGYCHKYLEEAGYKHRGTHGVCDDKWKMNSPLEIKFKSSAKKILEFDQDNPPPQHRRLSFDEEIESEIPILWDIKGELGFIKKVKPIKIEQSNISCEEIITESNVKIVNSNYTDPNVLKVIGGGSESWENSEDFYC